MSRVLARHSKGFAVCVALTAFLAVAVFAASGCDGAVKQGKDPRPSRSPHTLSTARAAGGCHPEVTDGPLPAWARGGFSQPGSQRHVIGRDGEIAAILFGYPYHAPAAKGGRANKILWVAKDAEGAADMGPDDRLVIKAALAGTEEVVSRSVVGGPGPSDVDLPKPGCWNLSLSWPGHFDRLDIEYLAD